MFHVKHFGKEISVKAGTKKTILGIALVNVATCAWATNMILGRYLRGQIGPMTLTAGRYVVASMFYALLLRTRPAEERRPGADLKGLLLMALTGVVLFAPILYFGLRYTSAVNGTLINGLGPLMTAIFAAWFIKEPFSRRQLGGSIGALAGVVLLLLGDASSGAGLSGGLHVNPGDLLIVAAVLVWAVYSVTVRQVVKNRSPLSATALSTYIGLPILLVAALVESAFTPALWSPSLLGLIVYLGVVPAGFGFLCWNAGIKYLGAGGAIVFYNTLPLYGALFSFLFLGETLGPSRLGGGALILAGGLVAAIGKKPLPPEDPSK